MQKILNSKVKVVIAAIFLYMFLTLPNAFAQINLNKIKDKAKDKTKELLDKKPEKKTKPEKIEEGTKNQPKEEKNTPNKEEETSTEKGKATLKKFTGYTGEIPPPAVIDDYGRKVGQILFSKKPIKTENPDKTAITNVFTAGDEVYGMAYLLDTRNNLDMDTKGVKVNIREIPRENKPFGDTYSEYQWFFGYETEKFIVDKEGKNTGERKYKDLDIFVSADNALDANYPYEFLKMLLQHAEVPAYRKYVNKVFTFQVNVTNHYGEKLAEGYFTYDLTSGYEALQKMYATLNKKAIANVKLESKRNDPALASKIKQVMIGHNVNVQKVYFSTADWGMIRHQVSGAVLRRSIWAYIVYKNEKGECYYDDVQFTEEFVGNAFNGIVKKAGYGTANGQIDCNNVK